MEELGFDAGQKQKVFITSLLPPGQYWNLKPSYALGDGVFPAGDRKAAA